MRLVPHWIGGRRVEDAAGRQGGIYDPASGQVTATVGFAGAGLVEWAVQAATAAAAAWSRASLAVRTRVMFAFRELVERRKHELAAIITAEHGKTLADALGEVTRGLEVVEFACGLPQLLKGEFSAQVSAGVDSYALREPVGVAAGITPFNFPAMVPMWMFPIAIACGNTFILKPSEKTPSAPVFLAERFAEAGLPEGVFNVVHGDGETVEALLAHPGIHAVSFVGSTPVARAVYEAGTRAGKRVQALGGAKNHMVVLPDADMELAADAAVSAAYGSTGQRCMAIAVLVPVGEAADRLIPRIRERIGRLVVGPGDAAGVDMGPISTREQYLRVRALVDRGCAEGADLVEDGRGLEVAGHERGFFLGPCLFDHVTPGMAIYRDEIFGPVLCVVRAETYGEAIALVNASPYANGVAIFTNDGGAARRFEREVQAGMVGVNASIPVPMAYYSFGGWKQSLFGDLHVHGREGVAFYTRGKVVTARWPDPGQRGVNLGFPE